MFDVLIGDSDWFLFALFNPHARDLIFNAIWFRKHLQLPQIGDSSIIEYCYKSRVLFRPGSSKSHAIF